MKDFLKYTLASLLGFVLASIVLTILSIVSIAGMMASEEAASSVEDNSILRIRLQGEIVERAGEDNPFSKLSSASLLSSGGDGTIGLDQALDGLKKAAENDKVKGIFLEGGTLVGAPAELQELRQALADFKKSGKWIVAYGDNYNRGAYYVASVADEVCLNPIGTVDWSGMASEIMFYTGLMEKVGVKMQVFKVGTYKSAVEPYICKEMSDANREQIQSYLGSVWGNLKKAVAQSRKIKVENMDAIADSVVAFSDPNIFVQVGLVDKLCYQDEFKQALKDRMELEEDGNLTFTTLADVAASSDLGKKIDEEVAVYYAYGEIVASAATGFSAEHCIVGEDMMIDIQKLREDDDVKAVVIRVNSPGGSAFASEQIWREIQLLRAKKPVVISMGGLAASGGYYISCGANQIWAEPTTLTGSIGIFGMIPDASELLTQKLGLSFDVVKTNALSDFGSMGRPFSAEEGSIIQSNVNRGYELFTGRVAAGRGMAQDSVKAIAEGRVWTGEQALKIGLVDKLGDLDQAIASAAKMAELEEYTIGRYPEAEPWFKSLLDETGSDYMESQIRSTMGDYYPAYRFLKRIGSMDAVQARLPYEMRLK